MRLLVSHFPSSLTKPFSSSSSPRQAPISNPFAFECDLPSSLQSHQADRAWSSFKVLASSPPTRLSNSLVAHLSSLPERHNLKRVFTAALFLIEKNSKALSFDTLEAVFCTMDSADTLAPVRTMFKS